LNRNTNEESLGDVIKRLIASRNWQAKIRQESVVSHWADIMGSRIAQKTQKIYLRKNTLVIVFNSASLKNEMLYLKDKIKNRLNEELGEEVIKEVIIK